MQILLVPVLQLLTLSTPSYLENAAYMSSTVNDVTAVALALAYGSLPIAVLPDVVSGDRHTSPEAKRSKHYGYVDTNVWLDPTVVRSPELKRRYGLLLLLLLLFIN